VSQKFLIIVAGGTGNRMQSSIPKQFIEINGEPIIIKTIKIFLEYDPSINIIISVHKDFESLLNNLIIYHSLQLKKIKIALGGTTRFHSVKNGLDLINDENPDAIVAIHDAARPFVSVQTIKNVFDTAKQKGNAIPCIQVNESIRKVEDGNNSSVDRAQFRIVQTPQCFAVTKIKKAFKTEYNQTFTDDATVLEFSGEKINLVEGNIENIKITTQFDLTLAKAFLKDEQ
jgi:2-C-methyl-D-erythritol 4-phosphate cytidylyltransferase